MIVAAAIRLNGVVWASPAPARHHDVIRHVVGPTLARVPGWAEQGFIDSRRGFVSRAEARAIAIDQGQVISPAHPLELFSEDLW